MNERQQRTIDRIISNIERFERLPYVTYKTTELWDDGVVSVEIEAKWRETSSNVYYYHAFVGVRGGAYAYVPTRNNEYRRVYSRDCFPLDFKLKY